LAMAGAWAAMFSYLLAANFDGVPGALLRLLGVCLVVITTGLALVAVADYAAQYRALHAK
ncbi:MAG TPA: hypothetical protein VFH39_04740, partial [Candidatus Saccharimonadales bacterium]|nr:hypothetical protein [Candidatus Saccharimonadales bacterium]